MEYRISREAEEDLLRIFQFGAERFGDTQAIRYYFGLIETFEMIAENPTAFPAADAIKAGYRTCTYKADTIYYRISETVEIMAIIGRQHFFPGK